MKRLFNRQPINTDAAALLLRLVVGGLFFFHHGWDKVADYEHMRAQAWDFIGIGSALSFHLVLFAEFVCAGLVLIGFFTRLSVIPIFIAMAVAFFVVHKADPLDVKALPLVYMGVSIVIFLLGSGRFSVDALLHKNRQT